MEKFFKLKKNGTTFSTEVVAGITTFFAMSYIIFVNPAMLTLAGTPDNPMPVGAVFLATIIASAVGTLVMGLFANVPYAQAPGMGLNAFFTYTVCGIFGFTWQEALTIVFVCGLINVLITVTRLRKLIIKCIPVSLQNAIGGGIGIFIAYIGIKNAGLIKFTADPGTYTQLDSGTVIASSAATPELVAFNNPAVLLGIIGIAITVILIVLKAKAAILLGIILTTLIGIPMGVVDLSAFGTTSGLSQSFQELGSTFGVIFTSKGLGSLFSDPARIPLVLMTVFAFSVSDTFDTIGAFIGTGRTTGIFSEEDQKALEESKGFKSKMDKALFADAIATSIGAIFGTSNTTTYLESAAGIGAGGRTGLASVVTAILLLLSSLLAPVMGIVPSQATAPALIIVGVMMMASFVDIDWKDMEEAIPCFFAAIFMAICYSISYGIAAAFIFYCIIKIIKGKVKEIHPILWVATALFIINFIILAII